MERRSHPRRPLGAFLRDPPVIFPQAVYCWGSILDPGSVSGSCPPLVLVLAAPLNSVAGLCGPALCPGLVLLLCSSCPSLGCAHELCGWALWPGSVAGLWPAPELCGLALCLGLVLLLSCCSLVFSYGRTISGRCPCRQKPLIKQFARAYQEIVFDYSKVGPNESF